MKEKILIPFIGRSSSGKTTLIKELQLRGYQAIEEVARGVLEERATIPITPEEQLIRQKTIYQRHLDLEKSLTGTIFVDRGLIDILGYTKYFGVNTSFFDQTNLETRYRFVFELEKRPFIKDGTRIEKDENEADLIYSLVRKSYTDLKYCPIFVPNFNKDPKENSKKRIEFILSKI
jgi:predicted ATPase